MSNKRPQKGECLYLLLDGYLSQREIANYLGVAERTVKEWKNEFEANGIVFHEGGVIANLSIVKNFMVIKLREMVEDPKTTPKDINAFMVSLNQMESMLRQSITKKKIFPTD